MVVGEVTHEVDVLVIGAGPGGYVAAIRAAQLGRSVTLVDKDDVGGVCLNRGCIPSKALISAAHQYDLMKQAASMGIIASDVEVDFAKVQQWKSGVVRKLTGGVASLLKSNQVNVVKGEAFFTSPTEVRVVHGYEGSRYQFKDCILATGSRPMELNGFPFGERVISSTEALSLEQIPQSLVIIGGGYIGVELGQMYAKLGAKVTILEAGTTILANFEPELTRFVLRMLKKNGITIITNAKAKKAHTPSTDKASTDKANTDKANTDKASSDKVSISYEVDGTEQQLEAEYVLVTVGRKANTDELGLDLIDVKIDELGWIEVDRQGKTSVDHIYAIGDVVKGPALAHKASYEGKVAAEAITGQASAVDYQIIPEVVYCDPELASVGWNETTAKAHGYEVVMGKFPYAANGRALSMNAGDGFVKLIGDKKTGLLLGAQVVGNGASELIAELGLAIELCASLEDVALTIHAHPSLGEMVMEAAEGALGQAIHQLKDTNVK